jgi:hypothetical protein
MHLCEQVGAQPDWSGAWQYRVDPTSRAERRHTIRGVAGGGLMPIHPILDLGWVEDCSTVEAPRLRTFSKLLPVVGAISVNGLEIRSV